MTSRALARSAGILYLLTFATSIPALALKAPFLAGGGDPVALRIAIVLEVVLALACAGTAVALCPLLIPAQPALAVGFVASRTLEAALVLVGAAALAALLVDRSAGLVALHDSAFLLGPGMIPAVNAALLATALLRTGLVPPAIPIIGWVGVPLLAVSAVLTIAGVLDQVSPVAGLLALPIALWELSLGLWLTVRAVPVAHESL